MIPGLIREYTHNYTVNGQFTAVKDFEVYPVYPLNLLMQLKLMFKKKHKQDEILKVVDESSMKLTYIRHSTYKKHKGTRIYLSSYISCSVELKT